MSQQALLRKIVPVLTANNIEYMLTGSIASSAQGEPRATHDIDLVVVLSPDAIAPLLAAFPAPDYFLSEDAIREALRLRSMFNLLSLKDGEKVDFWILTDDPFDRSRFARKRFETILDLPLHVSAPEDTILVKLRWSKLSGGSEKQLKDALRVYEVQSSALDHIYLNHWAGQLGVEELWQRIQDEGKPVTE